MVANKSKITRLFGGKQTQVIFCLFFVVNFVLFLVPNAHVFYMCRRLFGMKIGVCNSFSCVKYFNIEFSSFGWIWVFLNQINFKF